MMKRPVKRRRSVILKCDLFTLSRSNEINRRCFCFSGVFRFFYLPPFFLAILPLSCVFTVSLIVGSYCVLVMFTVFFFDLASSIPFTMHY
ncbi:hypothetical protein TELCIR_04751 [Teladorsagia circumcincta]|uniref:Uncharacterized protein n=1 Tax=Teladorsagia circumcincta TaxID=45464 RepID=A0A2G9UUV0_TELCI|nr:hypothetical protein TELCIR_04751 [Teladorsagia circumcincta]